MRVEIPVGVLRAVRSFTATFQGGRQIYLVPGDSLTLTCTVEISVEDPSCYVLETPQ